VTRSRRAALASLVAACVLPVIWPGDIPFINDEPMLVINAVRANRAGSLAEMGLRGTFGFTYGPFPTWVYQALTAITHDLVVLSALHAALLAATTAGALWWLSRSLRLWPWFAVVPLLSPYFWFFARLLWDNPFLIPLGALAIAGYAAQLSSESSWGLRVAVAAMIAGLLVHLMSIAGRASGPAHARSPGARVVAAPHQYRRDRVGRGRTCLAVLALVGGASDGRAAQGSEY